MSSKSSLDLREQVGQLLIMGFDGTEISARLRSMLGTLFPAGIILFKRNITEAAQTHGLLREVRKTISIPMFLCVDMEGGTVDRFRDVIARIPSVAEVAAAGSPKLFRKHGALIGRQLRALGFNTDFAPSVDLRFEASKSVLGSRTVSPNPAETIRYAREFLHGLHEFNILGCGKHFPGLGEANLDSHHDLPSIDKPWNRLWSEDLVPYREMHETLPFIMVAHVSYPQVTGDRTPASLSNKWITDILRKKIGYRGLVISDDLDMGGVLNSVSIEDAVVETLRAGSDLFLVCQKEEHVWRAYEAVFRRAERDRRFAGLVAAKAKRVAAFKKKSRELKARMSPSPKQATVDALRRKVWEFAEEIRMHSIIVPEDRAL
jgi:beta-N-acetylhexosaminidase